MDALNLFNLKGKTALITGSARGLGFAYAQGLASAGASIILSDIREDTLNEAVSQLRGQGYQARGCVLDVSKEEQIVDAFNAFDRDGVQVDIVINNAGIQHRQPMVELALKDWQKVVDIHLTGSFLVSREAAKRMIARGTGGKFINICSLTSEQARPTVAPYTAAKGGIKMLTRAMSAEWGQHNIQANAIGPGYILTDMNEALIKDVEFDAWVKNSNPAKRWGKTEELIGTAVFLSSRASDYINGQVIYVDGGWLAVL
ncbi:gluconate 5-dehydrogenase [Leminorella grimontii]|uniref:Gluconate 5-dehydrogenase n=1 Tax=Leminorella grimontii TaxID=82981 RepID=A0AAV5N780_9GAMM|nr:SDR family oxidoreductase [Leminorella grimontii]KFC93104.1 5-keto-D-gluconate 5-reductase [Leminorella grimontii ATCC 33999 = DSM 5078]GKX57470.1 gluconate 5-dehydrogenase [Leminorella grimontii]GKX61213.1 gluconate 5-dehydrogenase [Leminorella grimontii]VFS62079.1 Gluconate 5-dehydrogenase [Leminorella grimontii]